MRRRVLKSLEEKKWLLWWCEWMMSAWRGCLLFVLSCLVHPMSSSHLSHLPLRQMNSYWTREIAWKQDFICFWWEFDRIEIEIEVLIILVWMSPLKLLHEMMCSTCVVWMSLRKFERFVWMRKRESCSILWKRWGHEIKMDLWTMRAGNSVGEAMEGINLGYRSSQGCKRMKDGVTQGKSVSNFEGLISRKDLYCLWCKVIIISRQPFYCLSCAMSYRMFPLFMLRSFLWIWLKSIETIGVELWTQTLVTQTRRHCS